VSAQAHSALSDLAADAYEIALCLSCLVLLWRYVLSPKSRAARGTRLGEWRIAPVDFACYLFLAILCGILLSAAAGSCLRHTSLSADAILVLGSVWLHAGILLGIYFFYRFVAPKTDAPEMGALGKDLWSGLITFLIATPIVGLTGFCWDLVLKRLGLPDGQQELVEVLRLSHSIGLMSILVSTATLVVPISEELLFRAGLFRYFRTRISRWGAILMTSALFALLHDSWASFAPLTVLAIIFSLAYERTGSIRTTMVAHALFNLNTFLVVVTGLSS
jgi:hypothetical protein